MEDALSPNTSAFISYLSSNFEKDAKNPTSLPTSAFFPIPVPGRDTPEDTPPSSNEPSQSPEKRSARRCSLSGDSEADSQGEDGGRIENGQGIHKRKASGNSGQEMEEEDDDGQ